jgi:hypothetical protein
MRSALSEFPLSYRRNIYIGQSSARPCSFWPHGGTSQARLAVVWPTLFSTNTNAQPEDCALCYPLAYIHPSPF